MRIQAIKAAACTMFLMFSATAIAQDAGQDESLNFSHGVRSITPAPSIALAGPYTHFCLQSRLKDTGGTYKCNWMESFAAACEIKDFVGEIYKGAIIDGPKVLGNCPNGSPVVMVTHY